MSGPFKTLLLMNLFFHRLPPDKVWKPDIVLFNNADGNYEVRYKSNVLIYPDGEVLWVPPAIYQVGHQNISYT